MSGAHDMHDAPCFEQALRIRFGHCDPAGIVFYPQYFVMFNALVEAWVDDALGIPYAQLLAVRRIGMPTVALQTEFRAISRMGDDVTLSLKVQQLGTRSLTLALHCRSGEQARVQMRQTIVTTNLDTHHAVAIPADLRAAIERFQAAT